MARPYDPTSSNPPAPTEDSGMSPERAVVAVLRPEDEELLNPVRHGQPLNEWVSKFYANHPRLWEWAHNNRASDGWSGLGDDVLRLQEFMIRLVTKHARVLDALERKQSVLIFQRDHAEAERDQAMRACASLRAGKEHLVELLDHAEAERDRLREALQFYAAMDDINNYVAVAALTPTPIEIAEEEE